jgi:hypothetical protein
MTKVNRTAVAKKALETAKANKPATEAPKTEAPASEDAQRFVGKLCKIGSGKYKGKTLKVFFVTRKNLALCEGDEALGTDDAPIFVGAKHLEIVGDMTKADIDRLKARQQTQAEETLYVAATVTHDGDNAVQLAYPGWFKRIYFTKPTEDKPGMIAKTGFQDTNGLDIFEIAAWKVKKEAGLDSYHVLKSKQDAYAAIVEAKA